MSRGHIFYNQVTGILALLETVSEDNHILTTEIRTVSNIKTMEWLLIRIEIGDNLVYIGEL